MEYLQAGLTLAGPVVGYIDQIQTLTSNQSNLGLSKSTFWGLFLVSILKCGSWYFEQSSSILLISCLTEAVVIIPILFLCYFFDPEEDIDVEDPSMRRRRRKSKNSSIFGISQIGIILAILALGILISNDNTAGSSLVVSLFGYLILLLEILAPITQFISNLQAGSESNLRLAGDFKRVGFYSFQSAPSSLILASQIILVGDLLLLAQTYLLKPGTTGTVLLPFKLIGLTFDSVLQLIINSRESEINFSEEEVPISQIDPIYNESEELIDEMSFLSKSKVSDNSDFNFIATNSSSKVELKPNSTIDPALLPEIEKAINFSPKLTVGYLEDSEEDSSADLPTQTNSFISSLFNTIFGTLASLFFTSIYRVLLIIFVKTLYKLELIIPDSTIDHDTESRQTAEFLNKDQSNSISDCPIETNNNPQFHHGQNSTQVHASEHDLEPEKNPTSGEKNLAEISLGINNEPDSVHRSENISALGNKPESKPDTVSESVNNSNIVHDGCSESIPEVDIKTDLSKVEDKSILPETKDTTTTVHEKENLSTSKLDAENKEDISEIEKKSSISEVECKKDIPGAEQNHAMSKDIYDIAEVPTEQKSDVIPGDKHDPIVLHELEQIPAVEIEDEHDSTPLQEEKLFYR